jgi:hypothetical protein
VSDEDEDDGPPPNVLPPLYEQALRALRYVTGSKRSICEVHRCIYDEIEALPDADTKARMTALVEEAFLLGKRMDTKLRQYKLKHDNEWYEQEKPDLISARQELRSARPGSPGTKSGKLPT